MQKPNSCPICPIRPIYDKVTIRDVPRSDMYSVACLRCGHYRVVEEIANFWIGDLGEAQRYKLSGIIRSMSDRKDEVILDSRKRIEELLKIVVEPQDLLDRVDRLLWIMAKRENRQNRIVEVDLDNDYPLVFAHGPGDFRETMTLARDELNYIKDLGKQRSSGKNQYQIKHEGLLRIPT